MTSKLVEVTEHNSEALRAFGAAVRRLRRERHLSQEAFADVVGVHRTFIGGIERGERNPTLVTVMRLAEALRVTPAALLDEASRSA